MNNLLTEDFQTQNKTVKTQEDILDIDLYFQEQLNEDLNESYKQNRYRLNNTDGLIEKTHQEKLINLPSFMEVQKSIDILKEIAPEIFSYDFIDKLFARFYQRKNKIESKSHHLIFDNHVRRSEQTRNQNSKKFSNLSKKRQKITQNNNQADYYQKSDSIENGVQTGHKFLGPLQMQQQNLKEEYTDPNLLLQIIEVLATVFCEKGYNFKLIHQRLTQKKINFNKNQLSYDKMMSHIVNAAYQDLFSFLVMHNVKSEDSSLEAIFGYEVLTTFLLNCNLNLERQNCEVFYKIIKGHFKLATEQVTIEMAQKLYEDIERRLQSIRRKQRYKLCKNDQKPKIQNLIIQTKGRYNPRGVSRRMISAIQRAPCPKQIDEVNKLGRVWNSRYQAQLISAYKEGRTISQITDYFKEIFPKDRDAFSSVALRSQLYKILRKSFRKLNLLVGKYGSNRLPQLKKLNHYEVRAMIYNNDGIDVRLLMLDIYNTQIYDERLIIDTIKEILKYVDYLETIQKMSHHLANYSHQKGKIITKSKEFPYRPH